MKKKMLLTGLLLLLLAISAGCGTQQSDALLRETLERMNTLGKTMDTFSATVEQSASVNGQEITSPYRLWYSRGRYRMEWEENGSKQVEIFDGKDAWTYVEGGSEAWLKPNVDKEDVFAFLQTFDELFSADYVETATRDDGEYHLLSGTMKSNPDAFRITWWVDTETGFPAIIINETDSYTASSHYRDIRINNELDEALFSFTPAEGMKVTDISQ